MYIANGFTDEENAPNKHSLEQSHAMAAVVLVLFIIAFIIISFTSSISERKKSKLRLIREQKEREQHEAQKQAEIEQQKQIQIRYWQEESRKTDAERQNRLQNEQWEREFLAAKKTKEREAKQKRQQQLAEQQANKEQEEVVRRKEQEIKWQQVAEEQKQRNFYEIDTLYCTSLHSAFNNNPYAFQFATIRSLSSNCGVWDELANGVAQLQTHEQLSQYVFSYGLMHQAKLNQAFHAIFSNGHIQLDGQNFEIIDYGCGQGLGTICFLDFLKAQENTNWTIEKVKLIEPSELALKRGSLHVRYALRSAEQSENVYALNKELDKITNNDLVTNTITTKFHIFSNILDVEEFSIHDLYQKISATQQGVNLFICVSPNITQSRNQRLDRFQQYFENYGNTTPISQRSSDIPNLNVTGKPWRRYERVFKVYFSKQDIAAKPLGVVEPSQNDDLPF